VRLFPSISGTSMLKSCPMSSAAELAKHSLGSRVDGLEDAAAGTDGDDAIHDGIENRLDQRGLVAQGFGPLHRLW